MKIYYISVSSWDGRAYTFDYIEFFSSKQERDAAYEKLLHNADFDVCKGEEDMPEVFDTMAFQKGVQEGRRLEREDALTIADIEKLHTFLYAVKNNKHGAFTFTRLSDEQYEEVLRRFNNAKEK